MLRRGLLQLFGGLTAGALASPLLAKSSVVKHPDALTQTARRFAAARKAHPFLAGWESVAPTGTNSVAATVLGKWPTTLRGTLLRNGPGLFDRGGQRYQHWFDGDGLIQKWHISDSGITHQSRFVNTEKFARENRAGKFEVMAAGTTIPNARAISGPDDVNTANTSVMQIGGKTYALWEAGSAYEIDPDSLETIGPKTWRDDLEGVAFSAHPLIEKDGSLWNFGLFGSKLVVYQIGSDGVLMQAQLIELPRGGYMHSFCASESKLVFTLAPLVNVRSAGSFFEGLSWKPELGSLIVVVPKSDLSKPRFADLEAGAAYHFADAWDEAGGAIALRGCWYDSNSGFISPFAEFVQGYTLRATSENSDLVEIRLARGAKRAQLKKLGVARVEFPIPMRLMQKSANIYLQGHANHPIGALSGVLSLDKSGDPLGHFDFGDDMVLEEQLYVRSDDKRYTLGTIFNAKKARTGLVLMDLERLADGPIAQAWLDHAMPLGFHGTFLRS